MRIKEKIENNNWMSFSDIMTGLMIIFMFISISYMLEVQKKQKRRDKIFKEFQYIKNDLYSELKEEFKNDFKDWEVQIEKDLSIKFTNPDVLFQSGQAKIRPKFKNILNEFLPRYFDVLLKTKYIKKISEIRIEGHTDNIPAPEFDSDPYIGNIKLSQLRAAEVLKYFRKMSYYKNLSDNTEKKLQFWLTANGLSYGRTVDENGELTINKGTRIDKEKSRRVEFKIITNSEELVEAVIKEL